MEIKSRIQQKHDIELNWKKAVNFAPKQGEIIVYDIDSDHSYERFKIGDGTTKVNDLPFLQFSADEKNAILSDLKNYADEKFKSNYDLWLEMGYEGTPADFIEYLRGQSAYQLWESQEGNAGKTEEEFLESLKVASSNYDFWLSLGYEGTPNDFLQFLRGDDGKSAYEVWLDQEGNAGKSEQDFFASLGFSDEQKSTLVNEVNSYTDEKIAEAVENLNGTGDTNLQAAKDYADEKVASEAFARETADTTTLNTAKAYTDNALANFTGAETVVGNHNVATDAHNDIRELIAGLTTRLNALADSDDTTLDQLSEIVAYIKSNKSLIEGITTNKVNVTDIIDNLTTNDSSKVLSAAQGVVLKGLIDTLTEALENISWNDLNDKPFGEEVSGGSDTLYWDGNTEGLLVFESKNHIFYKVSDIIPPLDNFSDGVYVKNSTYSTPDFCTYDNEKRFLLYNDIGVLCINGKDAIIVYESAVGKEYDYEILQEAGIYFINWGSEEKYAGHTEYLTIPGYTGFTTTTIKQIDEKYIPDTIARTSVVEESISEAMAGIVGNVKYSEVQTLTDEQKETARTNIDLAQTSDVKFNSVAINYFVMKDAITGCEYFVTIENGRIVYNAKLESLEITKMPDKMIFYNDETLEGTGIEITAHYQNGTSEVITDYVYEMVIGSDSIDISYTRNGVTCTVKLEGVIIKSVAEFTDTLIDFVYTDNGDGTFTLTDWKGTYNGVASNRIIIPNSERIKL